MRLPEQSSSIPLCSTNSNLDPNRINHIGSDGFGFYLCSSIRSGSAVRPDLIKEFNYAYEEVAGSRRKKKAPKEALYNVDVGFLSKTG